MIGNYEAVLLSPQPLEGKLVRLRPFCLADAPYIYAAGSDPEVLKYLVFEGFASLEDAQACIQTGYYAQNMGIRAIALKDSDLCIGSIDLRPIPEHNKASFGYMLARAYWGKGYMTDALGCLLRLSFDTLDCNRVESTHYGANPASGRVMQKCGMVREGFSPQQEIIKGVYQDIVHYGILKSAWEAMQNEA